MELEFDKELDAILRQARGGPGVAASLDAPHLDADAVAAFVENSLPVKAKLLYTEHLADCGRCRTMLAYAVKNHEPAATTAAAAASVSAIAEGGGWLPAILRFPGAALAMGALVLAFAGVLGYVVVTDRDAGRNVAQLDNGPAPPYTAAANAAAPQASRSETVDQGPMANSSTGNAAPPAAGVASGSGRGLGSVSAGSGEQSGGSSLDGTSVESKSAAEPAAGVMAAKPMPNITASAPPAPARDKDDSPEDSKVADVTSGVERKEREAPRKRAIEELPINGRNLPALKSQSGPSRASGNAQQVQVMPEPTVTRTVGGRTFILRSNVWYDSAYRNSGTREIKRGSGKFEKLDPGIRSIAASFTGTVVIVWSGKAYKIY